MKNPIRYRLAISRTFPATHPRKGEETEFVDKIQVNAVKYITDLQPKIHTIRSNYQLWAKRFENIEKGEAILELYYWSGKPYNSKAITFGRLTKDDGIGLQKLYFAYGRFDLPRIDSDVILALPTRTLAQNDGLSVEDFKAWFAKTDLSEPLALIQFTKFRY